MAIPVHTMTVEKARAAVKATEAKSGKGGAGRMNDTMKKTKKQAHQK